ncbi:MAG: biotin--[acetyl-CoA-carboxylase] ligase [Actinobacteria bacterium]|nr:biotin--[acetyl-CoA-carboxylase] ligase [Actinomycetota bacterium]
MLTTEDLERALAEAGLAAPVRADEITGSTNATALELAAAGAPEWTLVAAGHQIGGRGRLGRSWQDGPDQALLCSFVLRPALAPVRAGLLTLLAGAALAEAARSFGVEAGCKWPNDLMTAGGKAGGILAEAVVSGDTLRHVVIGTGVNLGVPPPSVPGATALPGVEPRALLGRYLAGFARRYAPEEVGFAEAVLAAARAVSVTLGREVEAQRADGQTVTGTAIDLDARGGLVVRTARGPVTLAFGEVLRVRR